MRATVKFGLHPAHATGQSLPGPGPKKPTRHHHLDFLTLSPPLRMMYSLATTYIRELEIRKNTNKKLI